MRSSGHPVFHRPAAPGARVKNRRLDLSSAAARRTVLALLSATTLWAGATTWYLVFHDEVLARFVSQQTAMQYAYEERITALRLQLDRTGVERIAAHRTLEGRLAELAERQAAMEKRQALLAGLTGEAPEAQADAPPPEDVATTGSVRPSQFGKPFPTPDALELRMRDADGPDTLGQRSDREAGQRVARLEQRLDHLSASQARSLGGIAVRAERNVRTMRGLFARLGLDASRFGRPATSGLGGPLVAIAADPFVVALAEARRSMGEEDSLRRVTATLPLRQPIAGGALNSSGFGPRLDPFTRGLAMHTGVDMKAEQGEPARATAAGRVTVAEYSGGYGNMVEIDHGLATRYAHLSILSVAPGQWVGAGTAIGRVGSTGRSTGSHLHYETRIDGEPVDPQRFLRAGRGFDE